MITSRDFRDTRIASVAISYDWEASEYCADLHVVNYDGVRRSFRIFGLSEYAMYDDFLCSDIGQCTLLVGKNEVYLSLDPYLEGEKSDKDNMAFTGVRIEEISVCR